MMGYIFHSNIINFIIVAVFLYWLLFKKIDIIGFFDKKSNEIKSTITNSETKKEEAIKTLKSTKKSIKNIEEEVITPIVDNAKSVAKSIKNDFKKKLDTELKSIENNKEVLKEALTVKTKNDISEKVAKAAIAISETYIKNSLDENTHKELIYNFINDLDNMRVE